MNTERVIELLEQRKFALLKRKLSEINEVDLAAILEELSEKQMLLVFRLLPKEEAAEAFSYMESDAKELLINRFTDKELREVVEELFLDDTVDLIEEMPANVVSRILKNTSEDTRKQINTMLQYPKNSAGSLMTIEYVRLSREMTAQKAIESIRQDAIDKETIYTCYVTEKRKLLGIVEVKDLLTADSQTKVETLMDTHFISVDTTTDQEEVAKLFQKYGFMALPVVDVESCMVGIVTVDDAMEVMQEEITEDISKMAAITPAEDDYFHTSVFQHAKNRIVWLLVLMLSATVTGTIITTYENAFAAVPMLVAFIPMLMDTGGNCGSQSSTLIIRGIALDEIHFKDIFRVVFKEFRVALLVSAVLSLVNGVRVYLMYQNPLLALVVGISLIGTVILSKLIGCTLPLFAERLRLDPALMAAPLISTIIDTCSILIYFGVATRVFHL
jgi:magnesium transporter